MKGSLAQKISVMYLDLEIIKEKSKFQKPQELCTEKIMVCHPPSVSSILTLNKCPGSSRNTPDLSQTQSQSGDSH